VVVLELWDGPLPAPWSRPEGGRLERLVVRSAVLEGNPLGDSAVRPLWVYVPPGMVEDGKPVPVVYVAQGFGGQLDMWGNRPAFGPTLLERLDALFADSAVPRVLVVLVDGWTRLGGSQFLNSTGTGRYLDYLCDEVVPLVDARYRTMPAAAHRGITGKSSGGYTAMVAPMLRPDVFGALVSTAGDALFEVCCLPKFPLIARVLREHFEGSLLVFLEQVAAGQLLDPALIAPLREFYAYAACYTPDPARPGVGLLPFDVATGRLDEPLWQRWLEHDPVRMVPHHLDELSGLRLIHLDAGARDEHYLDLGAAAVSAELTGHGIAHRFELFPGTHSGVEHRYPLAVRALAFALAAR
jgi:S-formylglutathione hydrolase FrmB